MSPGYIGLSSSGCLTAREVLNRVGDKWSVLIVSLLGEGSRRFSELRRAIEGISQRMLTLTLRGLERDGLVTRTMYATNPPRVDYALTPLGETLLEPVRALGAWAHRHGAEIHEARARFDRKDARRRKLAPGKAAQSAVGPGAHA